MAIVDLTHAFDLHIHSNPSLFHRVGSDLDMARHAEDSQLAGILIKSHFEATVGRAYLVDRIVEGTRVFGSLVLNSFAGGINPAAVENAVKMGAKEIWFPTLDAKAHAAVYGHTGGFGYQESGRKIEQNPISILTREKTLTQETKTIVALVKEYRVMLGTGHVGKEEIFALADYCRKENFTKLVVTHPYFEPPRLAVSDQKLLVEKGAFLELCGGNLYPIPGTACLADYLKTVSEVGEKNIFLTSDAGQPRKSMPAEVLRIFAQCLLEKGVSQKAIDTMTKQNPARLLDLE